MARLILHIGTHKTATTAIQNALAQNRAVLERHGVIYPRIGQEAGHHGLVEDWVALPLAYRVPGGTDQVWRWLDEAHAKSDRTVILSSEKFCCGRSGSRIGMAELRARAARFDRVEVVCALRDQASLVQSFYMETARHRAPGPFRAFVQTALRDGFAGNLWLDYNRLYDHLLTGFAADEIRFVPFDAMRAHAGGPIAHFFDVLAVGVAPRMLAPPAEGAAHVSPRPLEFLAAHALTAPQFPGAPALALAREVLGHVLGEGARGTLFAGDELVRMKARFAPLNARLAARLRPHDPGFGMPGWPDDWAGLPGRDALDQEAWTALARAMFHTPENASSRALNGPQPDDPAPAPAAPLQG
ncbi:hypothetical protein [Alkalilacustris brevis]|uniref:hypothetical protein n=1 Tax=Alkalilacustris brevis TaxID=2026338 RepID=UPI0012D35011|nr:hypothetical protein [Alkalilacustris brevis]